MAIVMGPTPPGTGVMAAGDRGAPLKDPTAVRAALTITISPGIGAPLDIGRGMRAASFSVILALAGSNGRRRIPNSCGRVMPDRRKHALQWDFSFVNGPSDQQESRRTSAAFRVSLIRHSTAFCISARISRRMSQSPSSPSPDPALTRFRAGLCAPIMKGV